MDLQYIHCIPPVLPSRCTVDSHLEVQDGGVAYGRGKGMKRPDDGRTHINVSAGLKPSFHLNIPNYQNLP